MRIVYNNRSGCFTICTTKNKPSKKDTMLGTEPPLLGDAETQPSDCSLCYEQNKTIPGCIFNTACYQTGDSSGTWTKTECDRVQGGKWCYAPLPLNINYEIHNIVLSYNIDSFDYQDVDVKRIRDKYGPIEYWNVSSITDMSLMLMTYNWFNTDISSWNVSSVTDMNSMFGIAFAFNQPLNSWNVSSVTDMSSMFSEATDFNQPLNSWNVSSVTTMTSMFLIVPTFNQPLNSWNVSNVGNMNSMFNGATAFNQPLNNWNVSSVGNMSSMFNSVTNFNQDISGWVVSNVTDMSSMFNSVTNFNQNISGWDVSNVTDFSYMFNGASNFNQNISGWDINDAVIKNPYHYENFATGSPLLQNKDFLPKKLQPFF